MAATYPEDAHDGPTRTHPGWHSDGLYLLSERLEIRGGWMHLSDRPGLGFTLHRAGARLDRGHRPHPVPALTPSIHPVPQEDPVMATQSRDVVSIAPRTGAAVEVVAQ